MSAQRITRFRSVIALCAAIALAYTSLFAVGVPKAQALAIGDEVSLTTGPDLREKDSEGNYTDPYGTIIPVRTDVMKTNGETKLNWPYITLHGVGGTVPSEAQLGDSNSPVPGIFGYSLEYWVKTATRYNGKIASWKDYSFKGNSEVENSKESSDSKEEEYTSSNCAGYPWGVYCNSNLSREKYVKEKVTWIVYNSYPKKALKDLPGFTEPGGLTYRDAIAATQIAIWHFTDQINGIGILRGGKWYGDFYENFDQLDQNAKPGAKKL